MRLGLLSFGLMFALVACGGEASPSIEPTEAPTSRPTEAPTPIPTPTRGPTPTIDPREVELEAALTGLAKMQAMADITRGALRQLAEGGGTEGTWVSVRDTCQAVPPPGQQNVTSDLWPDPYNDLATTLAAVCALFREKVEALGWPPDNDSEWLTFAAAAHRELDSKYEALPELSPAELKQAIADRQ